jgi:hypothetical protein
MNDTPSSSAPYEVLAYEQASRSLDLKSASCDELRSRTGYRIAISSALADAAAVTVSLHVSND